MASPCILLTGFEPFGGDTTNPSWQLAQALHGHRIEGVAVKSLQLPCVFGLSTQTLHAAIKQHRPQLVLALGLAGGRAEMSLERVAINVDDARMADNAGASPVDEPVVTGAPAAYFSTLPIKAMVQALNDAGVPAAVSQTAGTFVCNHVFYGLMHLLRRRRMVRGGFVHVPLLAAQAHRAGLPGLEWDTQLLGVKLALQTALLNQQDSRISGGALA